MKYILIVLCIFYSNHLISQLDIPKKSNVIVFEKKTTADSLLMWYAEKLLDLGYVIDVNKDLKTITTEYKSFKWQGSARVQIIGRVKQKDDVSILELRGNVEVSNIMVGFPVTNPSCECGFAGDARKVSFKEMLKSVGGMEYDKFWFEKRD
jgi:hypothetical protein